MYFCRNDNQNTLWSARHNFFGEWNSPWLLDMGTSWYFSWKLNYFGIPKWKQGLFNIPQSGHESVYLLEPSFHSRTPNNSTFMRNISWCPCLKRLVNFLPRRNYAAHFTVLLCIARCPCRYILLVGVDASLTSPSKVILFMMGELGAIFSTSWGSPRHTGSRNSALGSLVRAASQEEAGLDASKIKECEVIALVVFFWYFTIIRYANKTSR